MVLRPLVYRFHPALPEAIPVETVYQISLLCKESRDAYIRSLLLSTIGHLPVTLQSMQSAQDDESNGMQINARVTTAGRNNEAVEQVVVRLSIEDDVSSISWSIMESSVE
jgi:putative Mg2+ transporter-C (MgtC) family protein